MSNGVRTRPDVWKLAEWDPTLVWYAKAIAEMQTRPLADPTSWRYQAAIHDYDRLGDPNRIPGETLPSIANRRRFWSQCQHGSWFFLPWHRMYLAYFEQIVAAAVVSLGGPEDWALPYWDYSDASNADARRLPPAFRAAQMPDGQPNPLRVEDRGFGSNEGNQIADEFDVDLTPSLTEPLFATPSFGANGFGGPRTNFMHGGGTIGVLEAVPHGSMHMAVGGGMGSFNTAGLDPVFWLHHANIDRLWQVWLNRDNAHLNPNEPQWARQFDFHDAAGAIVTLTAPQVVDSTIAPLRYEYEDVSDPLAVARAAAARSVEAAMENPEMVGATQQPFNLTGEVTTARLAVSAPTGPARAAGRAAARTGPIYLNIENIKGRQAGTSYAVYVNVPEGEDPAQHRELLAGILPMFGLPEASRADADSDGSGLVYALEIGNIVRGLEARNAWNPDDIRVTFVPRRGPAGVERRAAPAQPIEVGRVSLYYA
jgi:tyrosinase